VAAIQETASTGHNIGGSRSQTQLPMCIPPTLRKGRTTELNVLSVDNSDSNKAISFLTSSCARISSRTLRRTQHHKHTNSDASFSPCVELNLHQNIYLINCHHGYRNSHRKP
jgi:hypothetical protein